MQRVQAFDVVVSTVDGVPVDLSTLTDDQREALKSDIEEQLTQAELESYRLNYVAGASVFVTKPLDKDDAKMAMTMDRLPIEDNFGLFNGAEHTFVLRPRSSRGGRRKTRKGKSRKTRRRA